MTSALQSSTKVNDTGRPSGIDFGTRNLRHVSDSSMLTTRNLFTNVSRMMHCSPTTTSGTSVDILSPASPQSHLTAQSGRVATVDRHDTDAWRQERKVHDAGLSAVSVSSSLGPNDTVLDDYFIADVARSSFAPMELRTEHRLTPHNVGQLRGLHNWIPHVAPGSGVLPIRPNITTGSQGLSEGRRRVGEVLVRCGVMSPISTTIGWGRNSDSCPVNAEPPSGEDNELLITALAGWVSEWVHTLVIQPYLQGNSRFQYQGKPSRASASIALQIRRVLRNVENPMQVAIHALWFIGTLTGNSVQNNAPFLSVPIFRYLHNNGTFVVEEFMFRTFVTCAMIGDKTVNDATLSTKTWNRLTRIPQVILNATEKYALSCLKWNVMMTRTQWRDAIIYLRSCIKIGSAFDPFAYDGTSPSNIMARCLDELIGFSHTVETYASGQVEILAPQPVRHFTHREVFDAAEWCPEHDPVINQKPRTIGIAPGADRNSNTLKVGTTAKGSFDTILGSNDVADSANTAQPTGTSICGSFGAIGVRLAHTIGIAGTCQSTSWVPSHG